jgi:hypothetical protein
MKVGENWVRMGKHLCRVCGNVHDSGEILLHKNMRDIPENQTLTGYGLCPECQKKKDDDFVALVVVTNIPDGDTLQAKNAYRTGTVCHVKRGLLEHCTGKPFQGDMAFVNQSVVDMLSRIYEEGLKANEEMEAKKKAKKKVARKATKKKVEKKIPKKRRGG